MKRLVIVSVIFLFSAIQCSDQAVLSDQSTELDYSLISRIDSDDVEVKKEFLAALEIADDKSSYPMIAQIFGLPYGSRMIFIGENHSNKECGEVVKRIMATHTIDRLFVEGEMFGIYMDSGKTIKNFSTMCQIENSFMCNNSIVAGVIAVRQALRREVEIPIESLEFDTLSSAIEYYSASGLKVPDLVTLCASENELHPLNVQYLNLRDRRMASNIFKYCTGLKKQETSLVVVGYIHMHNLKQWLKRYIGYFTGIVDYETFQYVENLKFEQD